MDINSALRRYLRHPHISRWLFSTEPVTTVTPQHLADCFVYSIGFGTLPLALPRMMDIEDMLIVTSVTDGFVLGVLWGLGQPHLFSKTSLMLNREPIARRFAIDLSVQDALEFMEFDIFDDGKIIMAFRRFLHTRDGALPCITSVVLHEASTMSETLGSVIMRADVVEAATCPQCEGVGDSCKCGFDGLRSPGAPVLRRTNSWHDFAGHFMHKAQIGRVRMRILAQLPHVGEVEVFRSEVDVINVLQKGNNKYLNLLRRKAVHGLGVNVVMPRCDTLVMAVAEESDYVELHQDYVRRKRARFESPTHVASTRGGHDSSPDTVLCVDDVFSILPSMLETDLTDGLDDMATFDTSTIYTPPVIPATPLTPRTAQQHASILSDLKQILLPKGVLAEGAALDSVLGSEGGPAAILGLAQGDARHGGVGAGGGDTGGDGKKRKKRAKRKVENGPDRSGLEQGRKEGDPIGDTTQGEERGKEDGEKGERKHGCTSCKSRFKMRGDLLRHVKIVHQGKKMFTCTTCGKPFGHSGHLNRHISSVHLQQRRFKCHICGFQFFQASHLRSHIKHIHSGTMKGLRCQQCGLRFKSVAALSLHSGTCPRVPAPTSTNAALYENVF